MRLLVKSSKLQLQNYFINIIHFTRTHTHPILFIWSFIWEKIQTEMKLWLHYINTIGVMRCASLQQVIHISRIKKVNLDAFCIIRFYKQIYTLCTSSLHTYSYVASHSQSKLVSTEREEEHTECKTAYKTLWYGEESYWLHILLAISSN